ncbi:MAG: hypothetical protein ABIW83_02060 [Allosphingosinicella sp.]
MAVVLTDIRGSAKFPAGSIPVEGMLAYHESEACWTETHPSGIVGCSRLTGPLGSLAPEDKYTRGFLSVASYLAVGSAADAARERSASLGGYVVEVEGLLEQTSSVGSVGLWYYCQSCGNPSAGVVRGHLIDGDIRFGRSQNATYFITSSHIVAKLNDDETRAAYTSCNS